jgi:hypothetical protein
MYIITPSANVITSTTAGLLVARLAVTINNVQYYIPLYQ